MGRRIKETVDYFPHDCHSGKTIFIIETAFGNDGYALWFKLLEVLGSEEYHFFDYRPPNNRHFLASKAKISVEKCDQILSQLADLQAIDSWLWSNGIIFSENFICRIEDAYKRRARKIMHRDDLCKHLFPQMKQYDDINAINVDNKIFYTTKKVVIPKNKIFYENNTKNCENGHFNTKNCENEKINVDINAINVDINQQRKGKENHIKGSGVVNSEKSKSGADQIIESTTPPHPTEGKFDFLHSTKALVTRPEYLRGIVRRFPWATPDIVQDEMLRFVLHVQGKKNPDFPETEQRLVANFEKFLVGSYRNPKNRKK